MANFLMISGGVLWALFALLLGKGVQVQDAATIMLSADVLIAGSVLFGAGAVVAAVEGSRKS